MKQRFKRRQDRHRRSPPYQQQFVQQPAPPFGCQPVFAQPVYQPVYPVYPPQPYSPPQPQPQTPPQPEPKSASQPQAAPQAPTQDDVPNKPPTVVRRTVTTYRPKKRPFAAFLRFIIIFALLAFGVLCGLKYAGVPVPIDIPYITAGDTFTVSPREVTLSIGERLPSNPPPLVRSAVQITRLQPSATTARFALLEREPAPLQPKQPKEMEPPASMSS